MFYSAFLAKRSAQAFPVPCSFLVSCIMSLKGSLRHSESLLLLALLVSAMGSNPSTLLALYYRRSPLCREQPAAALETAGE